MNLINSYMYLPVSDFDAAGRWYGDMFGLELVSNDPLYRELRSASGVRLILINRHGGEHSHMTYDNMLQAAFGFTVDDLKAARAKLLSAGVQIKNTSEYQGKSLSFADMDGNIIELWQELPPERGGK